MAVSGLLIPPLQNLFQSWSILLLSSGLFCSMGGLCLLGCQPFGQLQDFVDFGGAKHAANTLRVDDREGGVDQVFLLHFFALDNEAPQQIEELHLPTAERGVGADELVKSGTDLIREAPENFDPKDVADELDKARLAVLVDLTQ
ncbi:hypothetical protein D3C78_1299060 [compost metagenome]